MTKTKKVEHYYVGFKAWDEYIKSLQKLNKGEQAMKDEDILGNAWIYKCLVQYREAAAAYLLLIQDQFDETAKKHLQNASSLYRQISQDILKYSGRLMEFSADYDSLKESVTWTKEMYHDQIRKLKQALPLEIRAIDEIEKALASLSI